MDTTYGQPTHSAMHPVHSAMEREQTAMEREHPAMEREHPARLSDQNCRLNTFVCSQCNNSFPNRSRLLDHMQRKTPCGPVTENDLIASLERKFTALQDKYEAIPKSMYNKKTLKLLVTQIDRTFHALCRYKKVDDETKQAGLDDIEKMRQEVKALQTSRK